MIHILPSNGYVDHGFYMFSPTLFWDYYSVNNWEIKESLLIRHSQEPRIFLWDIYKYTPGCLDKFSFGGLRGLHCICFVVKKTDKSTFNASVQQGAYFKKWKSTPSTGSITFGTNNSREKKNTGMLPKWLRHILHPLYVYVLSKIPLRFHLKIVGRY